MKKTSKESFGTIKSRQVILNQLQIAKGLGFKLPEHISDDQFINGLVKGCPEDKRKLLQDVYDEYKMFLNHYLKIKFTFTRNLEKTLNPKENYGIDIEWRPTQRDAIINLVWTLRHGYQRLACEIPTGVGKSMLIGALTRAFRDTLKEFGLQDEYETLITTSRVNLVDQIVGDINNEDDTEEVHDIPLDLGDLELWLNGINKNEIRVLAGKKSSDKNEIEKDSHITILTYHGLTPQKMQSVFKKSIGLLLNDEAHRVTERVGIISNAGINPLIANGNSATILGPGRSPFHFYEEVSRGKRPNNSWKEGLAYYESVSSAIEKGELCPIRYLEARAKIDLSEVRSPNRNVLNESHAAEILSRNVKALSDFLTHLFMDDYPVLEMVGSKRVIDRKWFIFVPRVYIAEALADFCNMELIVDVKKKYGNDQLFRAEYVEGDMSEDEYNERMKNFRNGKSNIVFSCDKLGEGVNESSVNGIVSLRPYGLDSEWRLKQDIGRGLRINSNEPNKELLVVDGVFQSRRHNLASVLGIMGEYKTVVGGILGGKGKAREVEQKIFELLALKGSWNDIWKLLKPEEQIFALWVLDKAKGELAGKNPKLDPGKDIESSEINIKELEYFERDDVRFNLACEEKEKLVALAREELARNGYDSTMLRNDIISYPRCKFQDLQYGRFGDGISMIKFVLKLGGRKKLTKQMYIDFYHLLGDFSLTDFDSGQLSLKPSSPVTTIPLSIDSNSLESGLDSENYYKKVMSYCMDLFGIPPNIYTMIRHGENNKEFYEGQASIQLEGHNFQTNISRSNNEQQAQNSCSRELLKKLESMIQRQELTYYEGSEVFQNRVRGIDLVKRRFKSEAKYFKYEESSEKSGAEGVGPIITCHATIRVGEKTFKGGIARHTNQNKARLMADAMLFETLSNNFPEYGAVVIDNDSNEYQEQVRVFCEEKGITDYTYRTLLFGKKPHQTINGSLRVNYQGFDFWIQGHGISENTAKEDAARVFLEKDLNKMYQNALKKKEGGVEASDNNKDKGNVSDRKIRRLCEQYKLNAPEIEEKLQGNVWAIRIYIKTGQGTEISTSVFTDERKEVAIKNAQNQLKQRITNQYKDKLVVSFNGVNPIVELQDIVRARGYKPPIYRSESHGGKWKSICIVEPKSGKQKPLSSGFCIATSKKEGNKQAASIIINMLQGD